MLTEQTLRDYPNLVKVMTGVPADAFWSLIQTMEANYAAYERQRHDRENRQRAVGGSRRCQRALAIRVVMLLFYLRTHVPQWVAALLFGANQSDISRDLRRLLPLLIAGLPAPVVWEIRAACPESDAETPDADSADALPVLERLTAPHVLVDATEQEVARPSDSTTRKE